MKGSVLYGPRDVRFEEREEPKIIEPTDALIRISAACVCGSDLWPYRGISPVTEPTPMGHEYCGIVEEVGAAVKTIKPGRFVIGSFFASDNTCPNCRAGYHSSCQHRELVGGAQAGLLRGPLADGTLVATPDFPSKEMIPSLLTLSDVMGTGWFAAESANVKPGKTVLVVGDGAVGLLGVLSAKQMVKLKGVRSILLSFHWRFPHDFAHRGEVQAQMIGDFTLGITVFFHRFADLPVPNLFAPIIRVPGDLGLSTHNCNTFNFDVFSLRSNLTFGEPVVSPRQTGKTSR
jgi:hypothetical protein